MIPNTSLKRALRLIGKLRWQTDRQTQRICLEWRVGPVPPCRNICGRVAMASTSHAEGRQLDPGQVYVVPLATSQDRVADLLVADRCFEFCH